MLCRSNKHVAFVCNFFVLYALVFIHSCIHTYIDRVHIASVFFVEANFIERLCHGNHTWPSSQGLEVQIPDSSVVLTSDYKYSNSTLFSMMYVRGCYFVIIYNIFRFDFFSVDEDHVMSVARGPLRDAIPSYQQVR